VGRLREFLFQPVTQAALDYAIMIGVIILILSSLLNIAALQRLMV
jgi:hypothetical protein